ncbi:hypothetical protein CEXT_51231 [Caerostris extrusa]|uniref:Uncharacterized protein n=1 Tax=Caerostris extrusa TaxID=172846 RepID=A0AAV4U662_CAEEX|nr:hypothetical protein CEXT_51231 [Caerostris extrusa]
MRNVARDNSLCLIINPGSGSVDIITSSSSAISARWAIDTGFKSNPDGVMDVCAQFEESPNVAASSIESSRQLCTVREMSAPAPEAAAKDQDAFTERKTPNWISKSVCVLFPFLSNFTFGFKCAQFAESPNVSASLIELSRQWCTVREMGAPAPEAEEKDQDAFTERKTPNWISERVCILFVLLFS